MSDPKDSSTPPTINLERRLEAVETLAAELKASTDELASYRARHSERLSELEDSVEQLTEGKTDIAPPVFAAVEETQTLRTHYLCHCGNPAVMTFAFPGEAKQGRCKIHEAGTMLRKDLEPGRTHVAAVERFPEVETSSVVD